MPKQTKVEELPAGEELPAETADEQATTVATEPEGVPPDTTTTAAKDDPYGPYKPTPMLPNLAGVATQNLVQTMDGGQGGFKPSYINWARTVQLLREHAPDWMPELVVAPDGNVIHRAGIGGFLLIRFSNARTGMVTTPWPQAIMDNRNNSVPWEKISARDVTDTHRRGVCLAAAGTFGLAYELWAKVDLESGYSGETETKQEQAKAPDFAKLLHAIEDAKDVGALRSAFAAAWRAYEGDSSMQSDFKSAYDKRSAILENKS